MSSLFASCCVCVCCFPYGGTKEGLAVAVQFIAAASAPLPAADALALYERAAHALGDSAAMAMLYVLFILGWPIACSPVLPLLYSALRCLDSNPKPTEVERVRQLVSSAAAGNPFETTLWLAYEFLLV